VRIVFLRLYSHPAQPDGMNVGSSKVIVYNYTSDARTHDTSKGYLTGHMNVISAEVTVIEIFFSTGTVNRLDEVT
jgi:hypothetical protein